MTPKYPVFIPSKGRAHCMLTPKTFDASGVPYTVVVEPSQVESYTAHGYGDKLLVLPENGQGLVYSRNWIKDYSRGQGHERHWQFDDDIYHFRRLYRGNKLPVTAAIALAVAEEFVDRYENIALASFNSKFFVPARYGVGAKSFPPFYLNARCYTCFLVLNSLPNRWRRRYNEDTDMSLQVLADGWCTVLFNAFLMHTPETMSQKGGQTGIYVDDGRLRMARQLESMWPGTVTVGRRHGRPQHRIQDDWRKFDTPLRKKPGVVVPDGANEFGMKMRAVADVKNPMLKKMLEEQE